MGQGHIGKFVKITPKMAKDMLAKNYDKNRKLRPRVVDLYAKDMDEGRWHEAVGGAIYIGTDGTLYNGQHRLHAVIKHGKPVTFLVVTGISEEDYKCIDSGAKRTVADALDLPNRNAAATVGHTLLSIMYGVPLKRAAKCGSENITKAEIVEFVEANREKVATLTERCAAVRRAFNKGSVRGLAAAMFVADCISEDASRTFFDDICNPVPEIPAAAFVKNAMFREFSRDNYRVEGWSVAGKLLQGFVAYVKGRNLKAVNKDESVLRKADEIVAVCDFEQRGWVVQ